MTARREKNGGIHLPREDWCPECYDPPSAEHEMPCRRCRDLSEELAQLQEQADNLDRERKLALDELAFAHCEITKQARMIKTLEKALEEVQE